MTTPTNNTPTMRSSGHTSLRAGLFRNLIAICFLISMALGGSCKASSCKAYGCQAQSFTLTTQKSGFKGNLPGWKDTSTIEVRYHPNRTHENWSSNNHKFEKVNDWRNEWFTITEMLEHDKANNRINVQITGMKNRWIYYLEQDGFKFIEILSTAEGIVNLKHQRNQSVKGLPALEELKVRGDAKKGVYGFRVALQKEGGFGQWVANLSVKGSNLRDNFDAVSVRVHLNQKDNTVDYITIPNTLGRKEAHITKINRYESTAKTVVLGLTNHLGSQILNLGDNATDRRLYLGGANPMGKEGKQLLKFLVVHADESHCPPENITDESSFTELVGSIEADWNTRPKLIRQRRLLRLAEAERCLVE